MITNGHVSFCHRHSLSLSLSTSHVTAKSEQHIDEQPRKPRTIVSHASLHGYTYINTCAVMYKYARVCVCEQRSEAAEQSIRLADHPVHLDLIER